MDDYAHDATAALSYDDTPYEAQLPSPEEQASLAKRIGNTKVYLLSETVPRAGSKRKHDEDTMDDDEGDTDDQVRGNALLLHGTPIGSLPTASLFAYATHFDCHPLGLEWVDDERCVFVFNSNTAARNAFRILQKHITEEPDTDGFVTGKPIPEAIWPPEDRINRSLGHGQGLKGLIRMRWARPEDVKKRGAGQDSQFYRKHGWSAGKEPQNDSNEYDRDYPAAKRRRRGSSAEIDRERERAALDAELDAFMEDDNDDDEQLQHAPDPEADLLPPPDSADDILPDNNEPVSRMRSDYIASDGRTLLERTSVMRLQPATLESRLTAPLPRRARGRGTMYADELADDRSRPIENGLEWGRGRRERETDEWGRELRPRDREREWDREPRRDRHRDRDGDRERRNGGSRRDAPRRNGDGARRGRNGRPTVTQEDLDAELDAFLEAKD
ncbi:hypothetical protein MKEN_00050200 [Mycena kentingensis (nom. inval.)]|nr:hypothetical protein MKEN_00050200 [Mycena kentingensis (nom. inval.)]